MDDGQNFNVLANEIGDDKLSLCHHQFPSTAYASWSSRQGKLGELLDTPFNALDNPQPDFGWKSLAQPRQIRDRSPPPEDF